MRIYLKRPLNEWAAGLAVALLAAAAGCSSRGGGNIPEVSGQADFEERVLQAEMPVLVDFFATWCPPCKALAPILEDLAEAYEGQVAFVKVDVDQQKALTDRYDIEGFPTLLIFQGGQETRRLLGYQPKDALRAELDAVLQR